MSDLTPEDHSRESMLALNALCAKFGIPVPDGSTHEDLLQLIAVTVKALGWPKSWPVEGVFDGVKHASITMYKRGCRCVPCTNSNAKYQRDIRDKREDVGRLPSLVKRAGKRLRKDTE